MSDGSSNDWPNTGRRGFFREGLRHMLRPLADLVEERLPDLVQDSPPAAPVTKTRTVLRPPGALPEREFLQTCYRSGNCVEVCPVSAIKRYGTDDPELSNTPYIDADLTACVACDAVHCTKSCPSGALKIINDRAQIRIGLAVVSYFECVRYRGELCTICIDKCPIGPDAIRLGDDDRIQVLEAGCTGCGVCQQHCPTLPKAIKVEPR